jgi:ribosomal-protein-alanine N-acetyltransferase
VEFALRPYRASDFDLLLALDRACFQPDIAYSRDEMAYFIGRESAVTVIASARDNADDVLGFIVADLSRSRSGHIITIDVAGSARRLGIGTALLTAAEKAVSDSGRAAVLLEVAVENSAAQAFYARHGYSPLRELRDYYRRGGHALLMGKNL